MRTFRVGLATLAVIALGACSSGGSTSVTSSAPTIPAAVESAAGSSEPSDMPTDLVAGETVEASPSWTFEELKFGEAIGVKRADGSSAVVGLDKPTIAECGFYSAECDEPTIGDRIVSIPVMIKNDSQIPMQWQDGYFLLEFPDGTTLSAGDGNAGQYVRPDNMEFRTIRPGGLYKATMAFEAPSGPYKVLILTDSISGEPFAAWS